MARQKVIKEAVADEVAHEVQNEVDVQDSSTQDVQQDTDLHKAPTETVKVSPSQLPECVNKLLKCYPDYSELYIDSKGGVYPKGTQPNLVNDAILYQNPYYKS